MENGKKRFYYVIKLSRYIKGFGIYLTIAVFCNMVYKLLPVLTGVVTSYMVSSVLLGEYNQVLRLFAASAILVILLAVFSYLDVQVSHDMAYRILTQLRDKCYDKLDELAPAALMGKRSGDMISIILGDVETLEWFYAHTIGQVVVAVFIPGISLIFMGRLSPVLPLVILPFIGILLWIPKHTSEKSDEQGRRVKQTTGTLNAVIVDGVQGLKDIITFHWQQEYFKRFFAVNKEYSEASMAYAARRSDESRRITAVMEAAALAADMMSAVLVVSGHIRPIWLMTLFVLSSAIFVPIQDALAMSTNYGLIFGAAQRVLGLFDQKPIVKDTGNKTQIADGQHIEVCFRDVCFTYPNAEGEKQNAPVFQGIDFSFHTGETVALVGTSGGGKTTAARLLQRFWDIDSGSICINGTDIRELTLQTLRDIVTVVPQEVYLFNMSIEENLRMAKWDAGPEEIKRAAREAQAEQFIERLPQQYATVVGEQGLRLSGGERQRLSLAQAFLKNSPVLVLDEASANLDAENEKLINQAVQELKRGRATLVIAHRISTIRSADRIVMLREGRVAAEGTYDWLMDHCPYFKTLIGNEYKGDEFGVTGA